MKAQLHEVTGKNRWCGPTAIATVLGISTDDASRAVRSITGKPQVTGMTTVAMAMTLMKLGCKVRHQRVDGKPTAVSWVRANRDIYRDKHVILVHGHHFGTLLGNRFLCSLSHRETVPATELPKARGRVVEYIVVEALPEVAPAIPEPVRKTKVRPDMNMVRLTKLAADYGIEVEQEDAESLIWVGPMEDMLDDPFDDDHYCDDYFAAQDRVLKYINILQKDCKAV